MADNKMRVKLKSKTALRYSGYSDCPGGMRKGSRFISDAMLVHAGCSIALWDESFFNKSGDYYFVAVDTRDQHQWYDQMIEKRLDVVDLQSIYKTKE